MLEKMTKVVGKQVLFLAADVVLPGSGILLRKANQLYGIANVVGGRMTPEQIWEAGENIDRLTDAGKEIGKGIIDSLFD